MRVLPLNFVASAAAQAASGSWYFLIDPDPYPNRQNQYLYSISAPNKSVTINLGDVVPTSLKNTIGSATHDTDPPDFNYPCNAALAIASACTMTDADQYLALFQLYFGSTKQRRSSELMFATPPEEMKCVCTSSFFDQMHACTSCLSAHGGGKIPAAYLISEDLAAMEEVYCKSPHIKSSLSEFWKEWTVGKRQPHGMESDLARASTSSFSDPLGSSKTALTQYYTPPLTGLKALGVKTAAHPATDGHTVIATATATNGPHKESGLFAMFTDPKPGSKAISIKSMQKAQETTTTKPRDEGAAKNTAMDANLGSEAPTGGVSIASSLPADSSAGSVSSFMSSSVSMPASSSIVVSSSASNATSGNSGLKFKNGTQAMQNQTKGSHIYASMSASADVGPPKTLRARLAGAVGIAAVFAMF